MPPTIEKKEPVVATVEPTGLNPLQMEINRLKAELGALRAREEKAKVDLDSTPGTKKRYKVSLPAVKVRLPDDDKGYRMEDHLIVEAVSPADAFEKFKQYNGILTTVQVPKVEAL